MTEPRWVYLLYYQRGEDEDGLPRQALVGVFETLALAEAWASSADALLGPDGTTEPAIPLDALAPTTSLGGPWLAVRRRLNRPVPTDRGLALGSCLFGFVMADEAEVAS